MSVFDKLPLALLPHHDGSALYVPNQKPQLGDSIKIRIRIHKTLGAVKEVRVRFSESGEAFPSPLAKVVLLLVCATFRSRTQAISRDGASSIG